MKSTKWSKNWSYVTTKYVLSREASMLLQWKQQLKFTNKAVAAMLDISTYRLSKYLSGESQLPNEVFDRFLDWRERHSAYDWYPYESISSK